MKTRVLVAMCASTILPLGVSAGYNATWDWKNNARTIYFDFAPAGSDYDLDKVKVGGGQFNPITLKDSFKTAIDIWNRVQGNANCKWNLKVGVALNNEPQIMVMLGAGKNGMQPVDDNGVPRFNPPPSIESDFEDGTWPESGPDGPGPYNGLAFFRRHMTGNIATHGEIIFNPSAGWGLTLANEYDPVIASLHEIGHTMRLMDMAGVKIQGNPYFGSIMGAAMKPGVHDANADLNGLYNPSMGDIADVMQSCTDCSIPSPSVGTAFLAFAGFAGSRRRRAA